jgi:hypothetical protein
MKGIMKLNPRRQSIQIPSPIKLGQYNILEHAFSETAIVAQEQKKRAS